MEKGSKEWCINSSEEEIRNWIHEPNINILEHMRRHNLVYYDYGLSRAGILLNPISSGELKIFI